MHRSRSLALLTALLLALVLPAPAALAQQGGQQQPGSGAFGPLPPPAPEPTAEPEPIDTSPDDGGDVGRPVLFAAGGGLIALFAVIGMFIARDARRSLPRHGRRELATGTRDEGPHSKAREAKPKARAKARAARKARKRNRLAR